MNDGIWWEAAGCSNAVMALLLVDFIAFASDAQSGAHANLRGEHEG